MKVPRLHVGTFPLLLLSLMASTSTCVEGKCSSFFYYKHRLRNCIATIHLTLKIRQPMILIVLVNSKIMKEKFYSFRYNAKQ